MNPLVDQAIAILFAGLSANSLWRWIGLAARFDLFLVVLQVLIHNVFLLLRGTSKPLPMRPLDWAIGVAAVNWSFAWAFLPEIPRSALMPQPLYRGLLLGGTALGIWARMSLHKNFAIMQAQREFVVDGAYRYVRHPLFTSIVLVNFAYLMGHFSWIGTAVFAGSVAFAYAKADIEERDLGGNAEYLAYTHRVRWRFIPGVY